MRRLAGVALAGALALTGLGTLGTGSASSAEEPAARAVERFTTRVFSTVPRPGFPAYAFAHRNGRVYAATYTDPSATPTGDRTRSRVFEWTGDGVLNRSWTVPGQDLSSDRGVQVATQDARGRLVLLEKSTSSAMTLDLATGRFRRWVEFPDLPTCAPGADPYAERDAGSPCSPNLVDLPAIPNFATWGPRGELFVSDYGQAVVWRVPPGGGAPRVWFADVRLDGTQFGTTGLLRRPGSDDRRGDLLIAQQSTATDGTLPVEGKLYSLALRPGGGPGELTTLWTSQPGELPDGFGVARSGRIYVSGAGLQAQLVVLSADGEELERFPEIPFSGDNGSPIPFDTPSSATFRGTSVLVANQSFSGDRTHHAVLEVEVGERGAPVPVPRSAYWTRRDPALRR